MEEIIKTLTFSNIIWQIITPIILCVLDILAEYIQNLINKKVKNIRENFLHKSLFVLAIIIGYVIEFAFELQEVAQAITIYICFIELMSILENLKNAGLDLKEIKNNLINKN